jgi:hypothetical protein
MASLKRNVLAFSLSETESSDGVHAEAGVRQGAAGNANRRHRPHNSERSAAGFEGARSATEMPVSCNALFSSAP